MHFALCCRFHDSSHAPSRHVHTHRLLANQLSSFHCFSNLTIAKFASATASSICPSQRSLRCVPAERRPNRALTKLQATLSDDLCSVYRHRGEKKENKKERELSISQRKSYKTLFKQWYATVDSAFGAHAINAPDRDNVHAHGHAQQCHIHANRPGRYAARCRCRIPPCSNVGCFLPPFFGGTQHRLVG